MMKKLSLALALLLGAATTAGAATQDNCPPGQQGSAANQDCATGTKGDMTNSGVSGSNQGTGTLDTTNPNPDMGGGSSSVPGGATESKN